MSALNEALCCTGMTDTVIGSQEMNAWHTGSSLNCAHRRIPEQQVLVSLTHKQQWNDHTSLGFGQSSVAVRATSGGGLR